MTLDRPWLIFDLAAPMRVLSWTLNRPGFVTTRRIVWREVRNADLPVGFDVRDWLITELQGRGETDCVAFLTSRDIERFHVAEAKADTARAVAVATVGLSNAERVGSRRSCLRRSYGTINIAVRLDTGLSDAGLIEALSIAVEARTAAVLDVDLALGSGSATGTGTDCLAVAAPVGEVDYAGLHTDVGEALGRAVYLAVRNGAKEWKDERGVIADA